MRVTFIGFICAALLSLVLFENVFLLQSILIKKEAPKAVQVQAPYVVPQLMTPRSNTLVPPPPPF